jgi:antirestriction protein ArdC
MRSDNHQQRDTQQPKTSIYDDITARIVAELEAGIVPWARPWTASACGLGLPENASTGRSYSGINILILWDAVLTRGFGSQRWITFRQALTMGANIRRGEKGTTVCYADRFIPKAEAERARQTGDAANAVPFLKRFTVFNTEQCEGLPDSAMGAAVTLREPEIVTAAEAVIQASGADFRIGGGEAFYHRGDDFIRVPPQATFFDQINYYRTCFHELGHWTGHPSRLARDLSNRFGSEGYAREELVAELASAFLCAKHNIQPTVRHADYIGNWLTILRNDSRAVFSAASMASKAADFVLAFTNQATRAA